MTECWAGWRPLAVAAAALNLPMWPWTYAYIWQSDFLTCTSH